MARSSNKSPFLRPCGSQKIGEIPKDESFRLSSFSTILQQMTKLLCRGFFTVHKIDVDFITCLCHGNKLLTGYFINYFCSASYS